MPIEFKQTAMPQGSTDNELYKLEMKYDGSGRRISKTVWRKAVGAENWQKKQVTHYTGIGTEIRENYHNESLDKAKVVVNMPNGLGRYGIEDAKGPDMGFGAGYILNVKFEWYLKNHLGSTMLVYGTEGNATSDPFTLGTPLAAYDYRAFGEQQTLLPAGDKFTENFTGKERDDEIALNYFGARYLDPMLGMWISVDPKRQFASPYLYAGNGYNPVNVIDPDGYQIRNAVETYQNMRNANNANLELEEAINNFDENNVEQAYDKLHSFHRAVNKTGRSGAAAAIDMESNAFPGGALSPIEGTVEGAVVDAVKEDKEMTSGSYLQSGLNVMVRAINFITGIWDAIWAPTEHETVIQEDQ